jgi:hypothetical protein
VVATVCVTVFIAFAAFVVKSCFDMGNYEKQVKGIKKQIPRAIQFIEENEEFLDVLLSVAEKLRDFAIELGIDEDITDMALFGIYYSKEKKDVTIFENLSYINNNTKDLVNKNKIKALFTERENNVMYATMEKKMNTEKNNNGVVPVIYIYTDSVRIDYAAYLFAELIIENPPREKEESDDYYKYEYAFIVTDKWGIYLSRYGTAI